MLDVEVVAAVCPEATINVYFAGQAEQDWIDSLDRAMQDSPAVLSISWGLSEDSPDWTPNGRQSIDSALQQAALAGITVCIASGDDGSYDQEPDGRAHVNFPASSPHALAVGGTQFQLINGQRQNEAVWFDGDGKRADKGGASGGGVSVEFDRPAWQTVQVASVNPNPIDGRVLPDIAALAGSPYYAVAVDGKWGGVAGTSAATPLVAALIALMIENLGDKKLPFLAPILYQASGQSTIGATGCTDITVGKNNTAQVGGYAAGPGFDACTGWGVPSGKALLAAIATYLADLP
jgi:kumamolisin